MRRPVAREVLQDQQRRQRAGVRAVEVAEVVVPGDLAAEQRALRAHARLEEGVPHAVNVWRPAGARVTVSGTAREARTS